MFGAVIFETLAVVSIFVFRRRRPEAERPYRCPGYPLVPALYVVLPVYVLVNMFWHEQAEALTGVGFIALGAAVYGVLGLGRRKPSVPALPLSGPSHPGSPTSTFYRRE
jgi:amino acid transporter